MSHWTKELLDLDSATWSEPSADMNRGISSALTLNLPLTPLSFQEGLD